MLKAIQFIRSHELVSGGLHPGTVGILDSRAIILSVHSVVSCPHGRLLDCDPAGTGPAGYTAPGHELTKYGPATDIWSVAVMAVELWDGAHPWPIDHNLWTRNPDHVKLRPTQFAEKYEALMERLKHDGSQFCLMLGEMLSHDWTLYNVCPRLTASETPHHQGLQQEADGKGIAT
jgi:hypothetical protein